MRKVFMSEWGPPLCESRGAASTSTKKNHFTRAQWDGGVLRLAQFSMV